MTHVDRTGRWANDDAFELAELKQARGEYLLQHPPANGRKYNSKELTAREEYVLQRVWELTLLDGL